MCVWRCMRICDLSIWNNIYIMQKRRGRHAYILKTHHAPYSCKIFFFICKCWSSKPVSTNSKTHNTLYTPKKSFFANIRYYFTGQKKKMNCRTNTGRMSGYFTRRKIFKKQFHTAIYQEKNIYNWFLLYDKKYIMPYTLQVQDCVTEYIKSIQPTSIVHTNKKLYFIFSPWSVSTGIWSTKKKKGEKKSWIAKLSFYKQNTKCIFFLRNVNRNNSYKCFFFF